MRVAVLQRLYPSLWTSSSPQECVAVVRGGIFNANIYPSSREISLGPIQNLTKMRSDPGAAILECRRSCPLHPHSVLSPPVHKWGAEESGRPQPEMAAVLSDSCKASLL